MSGVAAEMLAADPNVLALSGMDLTNVAKIGGGALLAAGGTLSAFKAYRRIQEGYVGIRTFNGKAIGDDGEPLHDLLQPGGHWMLPFFHDVEIINIQDQMALISTRIDLGDPEKPTQYDLEAVATWGIAKYRNQGQMRPAVRFEDAFKFYYGTESMEDLATKVAGATTGFLCECAEELDADSRDRGTLHAYANDNLRLVDSLEPYGVEVTEVHITNFAHTGVLRLTRHQADGAVVL
jgi:hypothetical protein